MKAPNPVNVAGWLMLAVCLVAVAGMYVLLLVTLPVVGGLLTTYVLVGLVVWSLTDRDLRAENDRLRKLHDAWNSSEKREDFADVGRVTGPTVDPEPPEWMDQSGYRPPQRQCNNCGCGAAFTWELDGFPFAACKYCIWLYFEEGLPDWVQRLTSLPGPKVSD